MGVLNRDAIAMGVVVRAALVESGLTQIDAASRLGIGVNTLSRRITGQLPFSWPEVVKVAELTGTTGVELAARADRAAGRVDTSAVPA